jgi:hypothetical protein
MNYAMILIGNMLVGGLICLILTRIWRSEYSA